MDMSNILNNKAVSKEFSIYNGTGHTADCNNILYTVNDVTTNRNHKYVRKEGVEPEWIKKLDSPLNAKARTVLLPPTIDNTRLFMSQEDFYVPEIDLAPRTSFSGSWLDIIMVSMRYAWACIHNYWLFLPRFYLDRLYIPQKVYNHDPDPKREQEFSTKAKVVGCILKAVVTPYSPAIYRTAIEQGEDVSAASLKSCILYYNQPIVFNEQKKYDMDLLGNLNFLQKWLDYKVAMNQNLPDYMFPTRIAPMPSDQGIRPVVTFSA